MSVDDFSGIETVADLGRALRRLRRRAARRDGEPAMTYRQLAATTGWSRASIGEYFAGQTLPPTDRFDVLVRLLGAAGAEQGVLATARDRVEERRRERQADVPGPALRTPSIVGRDGELAVLARAVRHTEGGGGGAMFVLGEPGIGKTRLGKEIENLAADMRILRGRAGRPPVQFRPLAEALFSVLRHSHLPDDPELEPYRPALSRLVPESRVARLPGADDSLVVLAEAVLRLLSAIAREGGCAVVLDDLHDADDDTLAVLDYLTDNVAGERVLLVGMLRPEPGPAADLVLACRQRGVATTLELSTLDDAAVAHLAAGCLGVQPDSVPADVRAHVVSRAGGNPFYAEELLATMVSDGYLVRSGDGWHCTGVPGDGAPPAVLASVTGRVARLGPLGPRVLRPAALLGQRFPAELLSAMAGVDRAESLAVLRAAIAIHLVVADDGCYAFRHALVAEALRGSLLPEERVELSRRAALAIEADYPGLPDQWCVLAAELWQRAGDIRRSAELFGEAGHRAAARGAVATAVTLFEHSLDMLRDNGFPLPATLLEALLDALVAAGHLPRALELGAQLAAGAGRANVHLRLARAAAAAADWPAGQRELDAARTLLGPAPAPDVAVRVDAVAAQLAFADPGPERLARAEALAGRALRAATRLSLPDIACESLEVLGICARTRDLDESDALFSRALDLAEGHDLALWRLRLLFHLGAQDGIRSADPARLTEAHDAALRAGAIVTALDIAAELAMVHLARAEYGEADRYARACGESATRMRSAELTVVATGLRVCVAAQQGRRAETTGLLETYDRLGGRGSEFTSVVWGFGLAFCSLLEEDRVRALAELEHAVATEADRPPQYLSFTPGPHLFLAVLAGRAGRAERQALAASAQGIARWNRQFLALADAVLAGRAGDHHAAAGAVARFQRIAGPYPLTLHIGLRLVAETAARDGWGTPQPWANAAEEYFRGRAPRVAAACRALRHRR